MSLKRVARNDVVIEKLQEATKRTNTIMTHGLHFLKLYLLHCYETDMPFPKLDKEFVKEVLKVPCKDAKSGRPAREKVASTKRVLRDLYDRHYKPYVREEVPYTHLNTIKTDLLSPGEKLTSDEMYHDWIKAQRAHVMLCRKLNKGVYYDIQCSPQDYLRLMLYMMHAVEEAGAKVNTVFPLRSDLIPKHFRMDTTTLVYLCMTKDIGRQAYYTTQGNLVCHQRRIWNFFFMTHLKCFSMEPDKHGYTFDHMVETNGVSISILLVRKEFVGKKVRKPRVGPPPPEQYIDELTDYTKVVDKKLVAIDPNMSYLLYCVDGPNADKTIYRYTQDTRRKDTYVKKHRDYLQTRKHEVIGGKRVVEWEVELSTYNKNTTDFAAFEKYVAKKNEINVRLAPFYQDYTFRRMKMLSFIGR
ncbi:unnamed protein product [Sphagnum jensenii]|uniref:Transposase n=1 Tax=Sphagnum jensenii TaxID=128206 RepID=A0ABP1APA6_9BRYO